MLNVIAVIVFIISTSTASRRHYMFGPRIVNISPKQTVDVGDSLELDCAVDVALVEGMELAWVKILGVDDLEYLTVYSVDEGNMEYTDNLESVLTDDDDGTSLTH